MKIKTPIQTFLSFIFKYSQKLFPFPFHFCCKNRRARCKRMSTLTTIPFYSTTKPATSYCKIGKLQYRIGEQHFTIIIFPEHGHKSHAIIRPEFTTQKVIFKNYCLNFSFFLLPAEKILPFIRKTSVSCFIPISIKFFRKQFTSI